MQSNKELLVNFDAVRSTAEHWIKKPPMSSDEIRHGLDISKLATAHPSEVAMTPIMKNMLKMFGDLGEGERLLTGAPTTHAEKWLIQTVKQLLLEQSKTVHDHYNTNLPLRSEDHYYTDCWLNIDEKKLRNIQPGQVDEINETLLKHYAIPTKALGLRDKLRLDPVFQKAVEVVMSELPSVSATHEIVEINLPFMTKHTNVGYKWFANDRTRVPGTNESYAQMTMRVAEGLKNKPSELWKWNVTTEFARYQKGKGRLILAVSRIVNLVLNQLEAVEIANYKAKSPLFAGYNDANYLQQVLTQMLTECEERHLGMYNIDYHRYDWHVGMDWLCLLGAVSMARCADLRSAELAKYRAALMSKTWVVAGTLNKVLEIFGRIFSGFIDTNRGGGVINALNMTNLIMKQDPHYVRDIAAPMHYRMLVMGDDNLAVVNPNSFSMSVLQKNAMFYGFEIDDPAKLAYGPKFLQYRVFEHNGRLVMAYPWPRVLWSALMKERSSGLGACGWTLSTYQQLAKLMQVPEYLAPVVNILAYFDNDHLMLDRSVNDIIKGAEVEDREASAKGKRFESTARRLYDGDPSKAQQFENSGDKIKPNYFQEVQDALKAVYDPNYLQNHGIQVPKK